MENGCPALVTSGPATYGRERLKPRDGAPKPIGTPYWMLKSGKQNKAWKPYFQLSDEVTATMRSESFPESAGS